MSRSYNYLSSEISLFYLNIKINNTFAPIVNRTYEKTSLHENIIILAKVFVLILPIKIFYYLRNVYSVLLQKNLKMNLF